MSSLRVAELRNSGGTKYPTFTKQRVSLAYCLFRQNVPSTEKTFNITSVTDVSAGQASYSLSSNKTNTYQGVVSDSGWPTVSADGVSNVCTDGYVGSYNTVHTENNVYYDSYSLSTVCYGILA